MQASQDIAGPLPTELEEWVRRNAAGPTILTDGIEIHRLRAIAEALAEKLGEAEDAVLSLTERIDELEQFKDNVDDYNEQILGKAYDLVDGCHHANNTDWISKAMKHVLMRDEFLTQEKRNYITACTSGLRQDVVSATHYGRRMLPSCQQMIANVNEINHLHEDISMMIAQQLLEDLPSLIKVNQQVSEGEDGTTYVSVRLDPKIWNIRADLKSYSPVDYRQEMSYGVHR